MKKLIRAGLISAAVLLLAINAWALPIAGDIVTMTTDPGDNYGMRVNGSSFVFDAFCVEKSETFNPNGQYWVESVGSVATNGGKNTKDLPESITGLDYQKVPITTYGDPISARSIWLYASFFDGVFDNYFDANLISKHQDRVDMIQNAIWFEEEELETDIAKASFDQLLKLNTSQSFAVTGWDIQVVNIVNRSDGEDRQSQLVGAPVPEPATMLLFGVGLLGIAGGIGRRRIA